MILFIKWGIDDFNPIDSRIQISFNLKDGYIQMTYICKGPEHVHVHDCTDLPASKCEMAELKFND